MRIWLGGPRRTSRWERRRVVRGLVGNIEHEGVVIDSAHHILVDDLSSWLGIGSPIKSHLMVNKLNEMVAMPR